MGPVFIDDLTNAGNDYYILTDHLGTPFGHHNPTTSTTYHTPFNPWGELLATHPAPAPHYANHGTVATAGFTLPPDATHPTSPLGLAGHLYDHHTGLVYMHNRHYHPRLGHFTTPDYRAPDIYDPTTYTEPYAYAAGNPILFFDPNGLATLKFRIRSTSYAIDVDDDLWHQLILHFGGQFLEVVEPVWFNSREEGEVMLNSLEYGEYRREYSRRESALRKKYISEFKANGQALIDENIDEIIRAFNGLSDEDLYPFIAMLYQSGALPHIGAQHVGRARALDIASFLVGIENDFYIQHQLLEDVVTVGIVIDVLTLFGSAITSKVVRGFISSGLNATTRKGQAALASLERLRGKLKKSVDIDLQFHPSGTMVDSTGGRHLVPFDFHMSFSPTFAIQGGLVGLSRIVARLRPRKSPLRFHLW